MSDNHTYRVVEVFASINGEGPLAGQLALFIRFQGCNLSCGYCDTAWANTDNAAYTEMTAAEIKSLILKEGIHNVTLTGGEPLLQPHMDALLTLLLRETDCHYEIETNGSIDIRPFTAFSRRPAFTLDYKLPSSGMENAMNTDNYNVLSSDDTVKFVAGSENDLNRALEIIQKFYLGNRCHIYLSPVFGQITPADMVDFMKKNTLNYVNLQIQMHKIIWDPQARGV